MEDDGGVLDGLAVDIAHDGDFNARSGRRRLVFAAALGGVVLGVEARTSGNCEKAVRSGSEVENGNAWLPL